MTIITLSTFINAPIERCFDLSRSVDLHMLSVKQTKEKAIAGVTTGHMNEGDWVMWEAVHFGIKQRLSTRITAMERPVYFCDEQMEGAFKSMRHEHHFELEDGGTIMKDVFCYETPYGLAGWLFDVVVLKRYMTHFLRLRNVTIKNVAEGGNGKLY